MVEKVNEEIEEIPVETSEQQESEEISVGTEQEEAPPVQKKDNDYESNVVSLREARERDRDRASKAEYERDQLLAYFNSIQQQQQQPPKSNLGIADDEFVEGKHLGQVSNKVNSLQSEVQEYKDMLAELKLNNEFNDFNNVVTEDNVKRLINENPELKASLINGDSLYNRGKVAYKLIKKFMASHSNNKPQGLYDQAQKPRSSASIKGKSQLSDIGLRANGYADEERRVRLEREMYDAIDSY